LDAFDQADTNAARGRSYEDVARVFLQCIPGMTVTESNVLTTEEHQEIDIAAVNSRCPRGLHFLPSVLLAEVKGWDRPIGSPDISWFSTKLGDRNLSHGFLFAAAGLTGDFTTGNAGHAQLSSALRSGRTIIVITRSDIEQVRSPRGAVVVVQKRLTQIVVGRLDV